MQIAMYFANPFGERRQDIRTAQQTAQLLLKDCGPNNKPTNEEFSELVTSLANYLKCNQPRDDDDETADMDALARMQKGMK